MVLVTDEIDRDPTRLGSAFGLLAAIVAAMTGLAYSGIGGMSGVLGVVLLAMGLMLPRPGLISVGTLGLLGGVLLAGVSGASPLVVLPGTVAAVMAWDISHNAASHGRQVGTRATTIRAEGMHALATVFVGSLAAGIAYGIYVSATGGQPVTAVALLAVASVLLVFAIRD